MASSKDRWTNVEYLNQLKAALAPVFKFDINPTKLIPYLKEQDPDILSDDDEMEITQAKGRLSASTELLERISNSTNWFQSLVRALAHPDMDKEDVVERVLNIEDSVYEKFIKAQSTNQKPSIDTPAMPGDLEGKFTNQNIVKDTPISVELLTSIQKSVHIQDQKMDRLTGGLVNLSKDVKLLKQEQEMLRDQCRNIKLDVQQMQEQCRNDIQGVQQMQERCRNDIQDVRQMQAECRNDNIQGFHQMQEEHMQDVLNIKQGIQILTENQEQFINSLTKVMDECNGTISNVEDIVIDSNKSMDKLTVQLTETKGQLEAGLSQNNNAMKNIEDGVAQSTDILNKLHDGHSDSFVKVQESLTGLSKLVEEHTNETHRKVALLSNLAGRIELHKKKQMDEIQLEVVDTKERLTEISEKTEQLVEEMDAKVKEIIVKVKEKVEDSTKKTSVKMEQTHKKRDAWKDETGSFSQFMFNQLVRDVADEISRQCSDTKLVVIDESQQIKHRINLLERNSLDAMDKEGELIFRSIVGRREDVKQNYLFEFKISEFNNRVGSDEKVCSHRWRIPRLSSTIMGNVWFKTNRKMRVMLLYGRYPHCVGLPKGCVGNFYYKVSVLDGSGLDREWVLGDRPMRFDESKIPPGVPGWGWDIESDVDCDKLQADGWVSRDVLTLNYEISGFSEP